MTQNMIHFYTPYRDGKCEDGVVYGLILEDGKYEFIRQSRVDFKEFSGRKPNRLDVYALLKAAYLNSGYNSSSSALAYEGEAARLLEEVFFPFISEIENRTRKTHNLYTHNELVNAIAGIGKVEGLSKNLVYTIRFNVKTRLVNLLPKTGERYAYYHAKLMLTLAMASVYDTIVQSADVKNETSNLNRVAPYLPSLPLSQLLILSELVHVSTGVKYVGFKDLYRSREENQKHWEDTKQNILVYILRAINIKYENGEIVEGSYYDKQFKKLQNVIFSQNVRDTASVTVPMTWLHKVI